MSATNDYRTEPPGTSSDVLGDRDITTSADTGQARDVQVTEIRESIEQTRADMSETIEELQERLSPAYLKEQVKEQVIEQYKQARDTVREATIGKVEDMVERVSNTVYETRRGIVETVTANPIPSALVGIGLAWLWMNRRSDSGRSSARYQYGSDGGYDELRGPYSSGRGSRNWRDSGEDSSWRGTDSGAKLSGRAAETASGVVGQVQQTASNLADKARQTVSGAVGQAQQAAGRVADQAQHQARRVADQAQYQARRVEQRFNSTLQESPLAVGAVALAIGTAVGLAVPQTRKENEWMGEARDTLLDKAQNVASDAMGKVQEVATKVTDEMGAGSSDSSRGQQGATA